MTRQEPPAPRAPVAASPDHAEAAFLFLRDLGFTQTERFISGGHSFKDGWQIKYESEAVWVSVEYLDVQLDVLLGRTGGSGVSYFLLDRVLHSRRSGFYGNMFSSPKLAEAIDRVAADLRAHYSELLEGNEAAWEEVDRIRRS